jgi:hypothetical protein
MARTEARVYTSIWLDPEFRTLSAGAQRTYLLLMSQADLAHDGVIALRETRWARMASDTATLGAELAELEAARYVVTDPDAGELLVRTHMRHDQVYRQPNLLRAARAHLDGVTSPTIRAAMAEELLRLLDLNDITATAKELVKGMLASLGNPSRNPSRNPSGNPSENPSPNPLGVRRVVTAVTTGGPYPLDPEPLPPGPSPSLRSVEQPRADARSITPPTAASGPPARHEPPPTLELAIPAPAATPKPPRAAQPADTASWEAFWAVYPRRVAKAAAQKAWMRAIRRADPAVVVAAAAAYRDQPGRDPHYTAHPATWLNGDRWLDERPRAVVGARASPALVERNGLMLNERTLADLERTERLAALDAQRAIEGPPA